MMEKHMGDMAEAVAVQLQNEHAAEILAGGEEFVDDAEVMRREAARSLFSKIEFSWRTSDRKILDQIRVAVDRITADMFSDAFIIMDELYSSVRVPDTHVVNGQELVKLDSKCRVVWQKDARDREVEDWERLTGQDLEKCLFDLTRLRLSVAPRLNELLLEAVFAKHISDDAHQDAYAELVEETIPGRNAYASRKSRPDRYHAVFRYWLWSSVDSFHKEIINFSRIVERVRHWRVQEQPR